MISATKHLLKTVGIVFILLASIAPIQGQENKPSSSTTLDSLQNIVDSQLTGDLSHFDHKTFMAFLLELRERGELVKETTYARRVIQKKSDINDKILLGNVFDDLAKTLYKRGIMDSVIAVGIDYKLFTENLSEDEFNKYQILHESFRAVYHIAQGFAKQGDTNRALESLTEAEDIIDTIDKDEARRQFPGFNCAAIYEQKGRFLWNMGQVLEGQTMFQKYGEEARAVNNLPMAAHAQMLFAIIMARRDGIHPTLIIDELNKVNRTEYSKLHPIKGLYNQYARIYGKLNMPDSVKFYAEKATMSVLLTGNYSEIASQYWFNYNRALELKDWQWALGNNVGVSAYDIQILRNTNERSIGALESKLENERVQAGLTASLISQKNKNIMIAGGALLLLILNIVLFRYFKLAKRAKQLQVAENDSLRVSKELAELKKEKLESLLDYKRRQLTTTVMTTSSLNSQMTLISDKLKEIIGNQADAPRLMDRLLREINSNVQSQDDWSQFYKHFESVHPNFFSHVLKVNPDLSHNELRHAAYVLMNLSNKEVASMHNITPESAKTARIRLKKRLNLTREDSLQGYINSLIDEPDKMLKQA